MTMKKEEGVLNIKHENAGFPTFVRIFKVGTSTPAQEVAGKHRNCGCQTTVIAEEEGRTNTTSDR